MSRGVHRNPIHPQIKHANVSLHTHTHVHIIYMHLYVSRGALDKSIAEYACTSVYIYLKMRDFFCLDEFKSGSKGFALL